MKRTIWIAATLALVLAGCQSWHGDAEVRPFKNGGTDEEWAEGTPAYMTLYEAHCPPEFRR